MQAGGEKSQKSDPLKAIVQTGEIGFYPLNSLSVSALFHGQTNCLIGNRDDKRCGQLRNQSEFEVSDQNIPIKNALFTGLCDAFYRGKLPELVVVTTDMTGIPAFIEELMDFLEKLSALGFLTSNDGDRVALLDRYVPQWVIGTYGVVFDAILEKLDTAIDNLGTLSARQEDRLLQKFTRAIFTSPEEGYDLALSSSLKLFGKPLAVNLAGSKSMYTVRTTQLLENHKIACHFNPNAELGILEWELNLAYKHMIHRILPLLTERHQTVLGFTAETITGLMDTLGQKHGILPGLVVLTDSAPPALPMEQLTLSAVDLAMLHQVKRLAESADVLELTSILDTLLHHVRLQAESAAALPARAEQQ